MCIGRRPPAPLPPLRPPRTTRCPTPGRTLRHTQQHGTQAAPPPAADANDPGPPTLKRGNVADASREKSAPVPAQTAPPASVSAPPPRLQRSRQITRRPRPLASRPWRPTRMTGSIGSFGGTIPVTRGDDLIRKAADTALDFTEKLPNYLCQELMSRYESTTKPCQLARARCGRHGSGVSGPKRGLPQGHAERPADQQEAGRTRRRVVHRRIRHRADRSVCARRQRPNSITSAIRAWRGC